MADITNKGKATVRQLFTVKTDDGKIYYHVVDSYKDLVYSHKDHIDKLGLSEDQKVINTTHSLGPVIIH